MLGFILIIILIGVLMYRSARRPNKFPPGPVRIPFVGSLLSVHPKLPSKTFFAWSLKYGGIYSVKFGAETMIVLNDPDIIRKALASNDFLRRPSNWAFTAMAIHSNAGLLSSWGGIWQDHRRFTLRNLRDFGLGKSSIEQIVKHEILEQLSNIKNKAGKPLELSWDFNVAITNVIWRITAGRRLDPDSPEIHRIHEIVQKITQASRQMAFYDFFPWIVRFFPESLIGVRTLKGYNEAFISFFTEEISNRKANIKGSQTEALIDTYLHRIKKEAKNPEHDQHFEEYNLMRVIADLFIAGGETTYTTLRWAFLALVKFPEIQQKIQREMDEIIGRERLPTLDDRPNLKYLEAFINEVQRVANTVTLGVPHAAVRDVEFMGYNIPKGTQIISNLYACHMNPKYWGDPEEFRPERFLNDEGDVQKPEAFMPFATGRRVCLGESLARTELFLYISTFLHQCTFKATENPKDLSLDGEVEGFVRYPKKYLMTAEERHPTIQVTS